MKVIIYILFGLILFACSSKKAQLELVISDQNALDSLILIAKNDGVVLKNSKKWVNAELIENDKNRKVKVKQKGDMLDHINDSFTSLHVKDASNRYSLMLPHCRSYHQEYLIHKIFQDEGVLNTNYDFISVRFQGKDLFLAKESHFNQNLLKSQGRENGPILRINEDRMWEKRKPKKKTLNYKWEENIPLSLTEKIKIYKNYEDSIVVTDAKQLLDDFRHGLITVSEAFDLENVAKFWAISNVFKADHGLVWSNMRFYYNPSSKKLEQIAYDCFGNRINEPNLLFRGSEKGHTNVEFHHLFLKDSTFLEHYEFYLKKYSSEEYLQKIQYQYQTEIKQIIAEIDPKNLLELNPDFYKSNAKLIRAFFENQSISFQKDSLVLSSQKISDISKNDSLYKEHILHSKDENGYFYMSYFHLPIWIKHEQDSIELPSYQYYGYPEKIYTK